jgi:pimeloyl-ACP methyl ester carboxylesterase
MRAEESYEPDPAAFATLSIPVLLLLGSESPEWATRGTEVVRALLPASRVVVLEGQGHMATMTAPDLLAAEVARFLADD